MSEKNIEEVFLALFLNVFYGLVTETVTVSHLTENYFPFTQFVAHMSEEGLVYLL